MLNCLTNDLPIPKKYKDHALTGNYKGFRDCHIKPDLVLIYRVQSDTVDLVRLGSHSAVFD
nr:type II toxin-antitoxin system YafQ family toxin [uncultured Psychrobacter sp.]